MKFSEQWLREWVNPSISTSELAEQLTMAGLEVDAIEPVAPALEYVVVGEVVAISAHPDAERLQVCSVNIGEPEPLTIVCGAANVAVGMRVPTAKVGAVLVGEMKIKRAKLRGVESFGMLCSVAEIGLAESADGLMALPEDAPVGEPISDYLKLDDCSIEVGLTPNRGDCLSIAGIAREVAAINQGEITPPSIVPVPSTIADALTIEVCAPIACPRYVGRVIKGVDVSVQTPLWMQERLRRCGLRSISPVVDITNYVMLELGQPMHAFDLEEIEGHIQVRHANVDEKLTLLDGKEITLKKETLVIADQSGAQAIAGVMGGEASSVTTRTTELFLESAFFSPDAIAGQARQYGLHTDSSHRFERGVDFSLANQAMERATQLLLDVVGGCAGPVIEVLDEEKLPDRAPVELRQSNIKRLLGVEIPSEKISESLSFLGMAVHSKSDSWQVAPPSYRFDITIEADLIEEVARMYGYNQLVGTSVIGRLKIENEKNDLSVTKKASQLLVNRGYQEVITFSFVDPAVQKLIEPEITAVKLLNPIASDMSEMRISLWSGLLQTLLYNQNRQQNRVRFFECGLKFHASGDEIKDKKVIAGVLQGDVYPEQWGETPRKLDFFDVKNDVEALLGLTGKADRFYFREGLHSALHPGQSAVIENVEGQVVGWCGVIHPALAVELGVPASVCLFELQLDEFNQVNLPCFREWSKFPYIRRDIALIVDESVSMQAVRDVVESSIGEWLQSMQLFDVYRGAGIANGQKSLALGLLLQDTSRTLKDHEVGAQMDELLTKLANEVGATLRN